MKLDSLHTRLKKVWPEDPEQLHLGGWKATYKLLDEISDFVQFEENPRIMDLCCGEGSTAIYFSKMRNWSLFGIDISKDVIKLAKMKSILEQTEIMTTFLCGSTEVLPVRDNYFDVVYGQDPDSFSDKSTRFKTLSEIYRVLKPGGKFIFTHHWIPSLNWSYRDLLEYNDCSISAQMYMNDVSKVGFGNITISDISKDTDSHFRRQYKKAKTKNELEDWLYSIIEHLDKGKKFGIKMVVTKPRQHIRL